MFLAPMPSSFVGSIVRTLSSVRKELWTATLNQVYSHAFYISPNNTRRFCRKDLILSLKVCFSHDNEWMNKLAHFEINIYLNHLSFSTILWTRTHQTLFISNCSSLLFSLPSCTCGLLFPALLAQAEYIMLCMFNSHFHK